MGVRVKSIHLRYTLFTTQGVQLSGKVPFVIFEWLVEGKGFLKSELREISNLEGKFTKSSKNISKFMGKT